MKALLDTHVLLWWLSENPHLSAAQAAILEAADAENPLWVSEITLWEIATLYSLGRIEIHLPLRDWFQQAISPPLIRTCGITPAIAAEVAHLPDSFHRDPADRVLVATARVLSATLLTQDRRIQDANLVPTLG
jgi:PIN domain nuclease of toxin-antitoxin system